MAPGYLEALKAIGYGFAFVFLGQELKGGPGSHVVDGAQGAVDGAACAAIMGQLVARGVADPGAFAYLDCETPADLAGPLGDYIAAGARPGRAAGFQPASIAAMRSLLRPPRLCTSARASGPTAVRRPAYGDFDGTTS